jgi:hypothetical protein
MTIEELEDLRLRLVVELYAVDGELFRQKYERHRRSRKAASLLVTDLAEPKKRGKKP